MLSSLSVRDVVQRLFSQVFPLSSELDPSGHIVLLHITDFKLAPIKFAPVRLLPDRSAPYMSKLLKFIPEKSFIIAF